MRLWFDYQKPGNNDGENDTELVIRKVFLVETLKTPNVAALAEVIRSKFSIPSKIFLYLNDYGVDFEESITIFEHDDVVTIKCTDSEPCSHDKTSGSEESSGRRSILKKPKSVSILSPGDASLGSSRVNASSTPMILDISDAESETESSSESEDEPPKPPMKLPVIPAEKSDGALLRILNKIEDVSVLETTDDSSNPIVEKKRNRKRGRRGKGKQDVVVPEVKPASEINGTINLSSDRDSASTSRLSKDEWNRMKKNKRMASTNFVPSGHRNKHVRFEAENEHECSSESSVAGGFGGNSMTSVENVSGSRFPTPTFSTSRTPSASSTPIRLMPRQLRLSVPSGWALSKNSSAPVIPDAKEVALKAVHLSEPQTNKSKFFVAPVERPEEPKIPVVLEEVPEITDLPEPLREYEEIETVAVKADYASYPAMKMLSKFPKSGDRIAFKKLEMSELMTPEISNYKEADVVEYNESSGLVVLQVVVNPGVADKENLIENGVGIEICEHHWSELIDPRLMKS
ncbi:unnamed protein product [Notodromas monacha]|uniref:Coilin tudor domain-containing protein n=1 Tax=Notodromas monacha TaxID=399045 RepID=A0A7R9BYF2_9CRUS|nr:unnamed protein product [Notodromas monacha]CAG0924047.1 unnamed protein product [Notodromas monacha]